jgi:hypothetical protein
LAGQGDHRRLRGDTKREATSEEVRQLREGNERLKQLVMELRLANLRLKKACTGTPKTEAVRADGSGDEQEAIELVRRSPLSKQHTLAKLGILRSTYYHWQGRFRQQGDVRLVDRRPLPGTVWNGLTPQEDEGIIAGRVALARTEPLRARLRADGSRELLGIGVDCLSSAEVPRADPK